MKTKLIKNCKICLKSFSKRKVQSISSWEKTLYCSRYCFGQTLIGRVPICSFKKGYKPTKIHLERLSRSHLGHTPGNKGMKMSKEFKDKCRNRVLGSKVIWSNERKNRFKERMSGVNNPRWVKNRMDIDLNKKRHMDPRNRIWRMSVFERDNHKCKISNKDCCVYVEAHHILSWKEYPELRFNINNGITLCRAHHPRKRAEEKRLIPTFQELVSVSIVPKFQL